MKIALVHELLTMKGGAERMLKVLADKFPEAPIYTLLYDERRLGDWFDTTRVRPSKLQQSLTTRLSLAAHRPINHHLYLTHFPSAVEAFDFSGFDLVISSSSAFTHGIITNGNPRHLCFVQSPARYLWDRTHDVQERSSRGFFGPLKRAYLSHIFHRLRIWDAEVAPRPDHLLAASKEVQRRIQLYWNRTSAIVHPPVDDFWFQEERSSAPRSSLLADRSFLLVSTLAPYKRIDIAIEACNQGKIPLTIIGEGPDRKRLERLAGPTITFRGYRSNEEVREAYRTATATLFPGDEDFGLVPLESLACGTPVIALRKGGALETMVEGVTGAFFDEQTPASLGAVLHAFDAKMYSREECRMHAQTFGRSAFEQNIDSHISDLMNGPS